MSDVKIKINYYDKEQESLIKTNFPDDYSLINKFAGNTITVPIEDFKTYAYFRHQFNSTGYKTFLDLAKVSKNWGEYDLLHKPIKLTSSFRSKVTTILAGEN